MKTLSIISACLLGSLIGNAAADCTAPSLTATQIADLVNFKLVCGEDPADPGNPNKRWSEVHFPGFPAGTGSLQEWAQGTGHAIDPKKVVGNWTTLTGEHIEYTYAAGTPFTFTVHDNGDTTYSFCVGSTEKTRATVIAVPSATTVNPCGW